MAGPGRATKRDREAGYDACMWCVETGDYAGHRGHRFLWDREEEGQAFQFRSMEDAEGTATAVALFPDTARRLRRLFDAVDAGRQVGPVRPETAEALMDEMFQARRARRAAGLEALDA